MRWALQALVVFALASAVTAGCMQPPPGDGPTPTGYEAPLAPGYGWARAAALPEPVQRAACTAFQGDAWVVGGLDERGAASPDAYRYNQTRDEWTRAPFGLPRALQGGMAVQVDGSLQVAGGYPRPDSAQATRTVYERNPALGAFVPVNDLASPLAEAGILVIDGRPHLLGGAHNGQAVASVLAWQGFGGWQEESGLDRPRAGAAFAGLADGRVVAAGGWGDGHRAAPDVVVQGLHGEATESWPSVPTPRSGFAWAQWDGRLVLAGGIDVYDNATAAAEILDLEQGAWLRLPALPVPVADACAVTLPDGVHVIGGRSGDGEVTTGHWVLTSALG